MLGTYMETIEIRRISHEKVRTSPLTFRDLRKERVGLKQEDGSLKASNCLSSMEQEQTKRSRFFYRIDRVIAR
jgi:hypothetical protein